MTGATSGRSTAAPATSRAVAGVLPWAALLWAAALVAAAYIASRPDPGAWSAAAFAIYSAAGALCHQRPERSFHPWGVSFPVCARCVGIYAGACGGALAARMGPAAALLRSRRAAWTALAIAAAPNAATLAYEWTTGITPSNWTRAVAGLPLGAVVAALVVTATSHATDAAGD